MSPDNRKQVKNADVKIVVAGHKPYWMPVDPVYVPVQAGAAGKESIPGFLRDDAGEAISEKNPNYCELTALYWAWKNLDCGWLGLAHYRRHFATKRGGDKQSRVAAGDDLVAVLETSPVVLPKQREYFIETNWSQYVHAHHECDLVTTREILEETHPEYLEKFNEVMNRTHGHRFNMFIMRRDIADDWCEWLFGVLAELERRLDISEYSPNDARVFGFVAERLLDVWVECNGIEYAEMPVVNLESQHWVKKGASFLQRKLAGHASS